MPNILTPSFVVSSSFSMNNNLITVTHLVGIFCYTPSFEFELLSTHLRGLHVQTNTFTKTRLP